MTMYEKKTKTRRISFYCLNCDKFLGIRRKPKSLNDIGEDFCNMVCEFAYDEKQKAK